MSNLWLKDEYSIRNFEWQSGYADFSVSASNLERVKTYIANQHRHHRKMDFQDELRALLSRHEVEWDERYILGLTQPRCGWIDDPTLTPRSRRAATLGWRLQPLRG